MQDGIFRLLNCLAVGSSNPTPEHIPGETIIQKDTCTPLFTAALSTTWKKPMCLSTEEWLKKMWYMDTMEYYSAIKMNKIAPFA